MDLEYFNLMLNKASYTSADMQDKLREALIRAGACPMDVREADIIDTNDGSVAFTAILVTCVEQIPGVKDMIKQGNNLVEIQYEGLATLI